MQPVLSVDLNARFRIEQPDHVIHVPQHGVSLDTSTREPAGLFLDTGYTESGLMVSDRLARARSVGDVGSKGGIDNVVAGQVGTDPSDAGAVQH